VFGLKKNFCYFGSKKILPITSHWTRQASIFGPAAAHVFYSVKQLKTIFWAGLGPKKFNGLQHLCPRPPSKGHGRAQRGPGRASGPGRARLKMLKYIPVFYIFWSLLCAHLSFVVTVRKLHMHVESRLFDCTNNLICRIIYKSEKICRFYQEFKWL
jgi:hypothetical protein